MQKPMIEFYEDESSHGHPSIRTVPDNEEGRSDGQQKTARLSAHESGAYMYHAPSLSMTSPSPSPPTSSPSQPPAVVKRQRAQVGAGLINLNTNNTGATHHEPIAENASESHHPTTECSHPNQPAAASVDTSPILVAQVNAHAKTALTHCSDDKNNNSMKDVSAHLSGNESFGENFGLDSVLPKGVTSNTLPDNKPAVRAATRMLPHQLVIVLRHGERADEHTSEAMLDPCLTEKGVAMVKSSLVGKLKKCLQEHFPFIDDSFLRSEFLVVSSPFKRCLETAEALVASGVGSDNALRRPSSYANPLLANTMGSGEVLAPVVDARLCEVFGPTRIKANVNHFFDGPESGRSGSEKIASVFDRPFPDYFSQWTVAKGAKLSFRKGSEVLPPWGETLYESKQRYQSALCELSAEVEHIPACPRNLILVSHGDMLDAVFRGLYPMRVLYSVDYLGFAVLERRLTRNGMGPPQAPRSFDLANFRIIGCEGLMWMNDSEDPPPCDWIALEQSEGVHSKKTDNNSRDSSTSAPKNRKKEGDLHHSKPELPAENVADMRHHAREQAVGSSFESTPFNGQHTPAVPLASSVSEAKRGYDTIPTRGDSQTQRAGLQSSSCDEAYTDDYDDAYDERRGLRDDHRPSSTRGAVLGRILGNMSAASAAVFASGYGCAAGLHFAAFAWAAVNASQNGGAIVVSNTTNPGALDKNKSSPAHGWAVGTTGSVVILLMLLRHLVAPVRVRGDDCEAFLLEKIHRCCGARESERHISSRTTSFHKTHRSFVWRLLLRLLVFICLVVGVDVAAAYIAGSAARASTRASLLHDGLNRNAGPWVLLGAALAAVIFTEGCAAPWSRFRQVRNAARRKA